MNRKLLHIIPTFRVCIAFFCLLITTTCCLLLWNRSVLTIYNNEPVNPDQFYSIQTIPSSEGNSYAFNFIASDENQPLSLIVSGIQDYQVTLNDQTIYEYRLQDRYQHSTIIDLNTTGRENRVRIDGKTASSTNILHQKFGHEATPQIVLSSTTKVRTMHQIAQSIMLMMLGMHIVLLFGFLVLYLNKRSEKYLLFASVGLVIIGLQTLIEIGFPPFQMKAGMMEGFRKILLLLPVVTIAFVCIRLFEKEVPRKYHSLISMRTLIGIYLIEIGFEFASRLYLYPAFRRILWIPVLIVFIFAAKEKGRSVYWVVCGYAISEGFALYLALFNPLYLYPLDPLFLFLRANEVAALIFFIFTMIFVYSRFAQRFQEADRLADELAELNCALEQRVEERTQEVVALNEKRKNMMLNTYHDLRSPLFALKGRILQLKDKFPGEKETFLVLDERISYLSRLTEELFLIAKLENHEVLYDQSTVYLSSLLQDLAQACVPAAEAKQIQMHCEIEEDLKGWGDQYRLNQAFQNILDNAINYTPEGGEIWLRAKRQGHAIQILFQDTGKGFSQEEAAHIFERYYVSRNNRNPRSSGLGLSIAREIIKAQEGEIRVQSELGKGTTFIVGLPEI